jgi:hypothetical protein
MGNNEEKRERVAIRGSVASDLMLVPMVILWIAGKSWVCARFAVISLASDEVRTKRSSKTAAASGGSFG